MSWNFTVGNISWLKAWILGFGEFAELGVITSYQKKFNKILSTYLKIGLSW
jgi:hypothetical protein